MNPQEAVRLHDTPALVADPRFLAHLGELALSAEGEAETVYGVWSDLRLAYLGPGWFRFAAENGAGDEGWRARWTLGRSVADAWRPPLDRFYIRLFAGALATESPVSHDYQCHSAVTHRVFRMTLHRVGQGLGLFVVNSRLVESPHEASGDAPRPPVYVDESGFVRQCMHCRRTRRIGEPGGWDWVPQLVERMPANTSHGLCDVCLAYYFPADAPATHDVSP